MEQVQAAEAEGEGREEDATCLVGRSRAAAKSELFDISKLTTSSTHEIQHAQEHV